MQDQARYPPGPRSRLPGGLFVRLRARPLALLRELAAEYGDLVHFQVAGQHVYLANQPDYVHELLVTKRAHLTLSRRHRMARRVLGNGLLTSEGELHRRQRRLLQPAFRPYSVERYAPTVTAHAQRLRDQWQAGSVLDLHAAMMQLTLAVGAEALFGADLHAEAVAFLEALEQVTAMFDRVTNPFAELLWRLPLPANRRFLRALASLNTTVAGLVAARRASPADRHDLLTLLLNARDLEGDAQGMSDAQLRDEVLTILLTGHETVATALTWTWHLLAQHPAAQERLGAELDAVLGRRDPTAADMERLPYTRRVLQESLRLYPPSWVLGQEVVAEITLGGYTIPVGSVVLVSQYVLHRDPRFFPEPEGFDPDRWDRDGAAKLPTFAYFPFGGGPRTCIGEPFAWVELTLILATLAQRWRVRPVPGEVVEPWPHVTLRPKGALRLVLEQRSP
jgi:cytochrome P450